MPKYPATLILSVLLSIGCGLLLVPGVFDWLFAGVVPPQPMLPTGVTWPGSPLHGLVYSVNFDDPTYRLGLCAGLFFAGAAMLTRQSWSRPLMEVLAWLGLLGVVNFGLYRLWIYLSSPAIMFADFSGPKTAYYQIGLAFFLGQIFVCGTPILMIIAVLRRGSLRLALKPAPHAGPPQAKEKTPGRSD